MASRTSNASGCCGRPPSARRLQSSRWRSARCRNTRRADGRRVGRLDPVFKALMKRGLMIRTMSGFRFPNWIRVTVVGREVLEQFVEGLAEELKSAP